MKVKIELTVDIDPDGWMLEFGLDRSDVREDVKRYCEYIVAGQLEIIGMLKEN